MATYYARRPIRYNDADGNRVSVAGGQPVPEASTGAEPAEKPAPPSTPPPVASPVASAGEPIHAGPRQAPSDPLPRAPGVFRPPGGPAATGPSPPAPPSPRARIDWERWIGVRGAALLGGIVLALAALLFFKYSIERGLISPAVRVILGTLVGVAGIVASEWLRRQYRILADALGL